MINIDEFNSINEFKGLDQRRKFSDKIMTAEEARKKTMSSIKIKTDEELYPIFSEIYDACQNGKLEIEHDGQLSKPAIVRLKELGYKVEEFKGIDDISHQLYNIKYMIYWNE